MYEIATQKIMECLEENLIEPQRGWPEDLFEERSFARWAAMELANEIMDRPYEPPDLLVHRFILKMKVFEMETRDPNRSRIFRIASEAAEDILTLF